METSRHSAYGSQPGAEDTLLFMFIPIFIRKKSSFSKKGGKLVPVICTILAAGLFVDWLFSFHVK